MTAKTVTIESKDYVFNTLKEAQKYYDAIVKELFEAKLTLTKGQDFEDLKWIYTTYCGYTNHNVDRLKESDIVGFKGISTVQQKGGQYVPTECAAIIEICCRLNLIEQKLNDEGRELLFRIVSMLIGLVK